MSEAFTRRFDPWTQGQVITIRNITRSGRIWDATPLRVVEDSPQLTVLYKANGTIYKRPKGIDEVNPDPRAHSAIDLHRAGGLRRRPDHPSRSQLVLQRRKRVLSSH